MVGGLIAMSGDQKETIAGMVVTITVAKVRAMQGKEVRGARETQNARKMATGTAREGVIDMASGSAYASVTATGTVNETRRRNLVVSANESGIEIVTATDTGIGIARMRRIATAERDAMLLVNLRQQAVCLSWMNEDCHHGQSHHGTEMVMSLLGRGDARPTTRYAMRVTPSLTAN